MVAKCSPGTPVIANSLWLTSPVFPTLWSVIMTRGRSRPSSWKWSQYRSAASGTAQSPFRGNGARRGRSCCFACKNSAQGASLREICTCRAGLPLVEVENVGVPMRDEQVLQSRAAEVQVRFGLVIRTPVYSGALRRTLGTDVLSMLCLGCSKHGRPGTAVATSTP